MILADLFGVECLSDSFGAILLCEGLGTTLGVPVAGMSRSYIHYFQLRRVYQKRLSKRPASRGLRVVFLVLAFLGIYATRLLPAVGSC